MDVSPFPVEHVEAGDHLLDDLGNGAIITERE